MQQLLLLKLLLLLILSIIRDVSRRLLEHVLLVCLDKVVFLVGAYVRLLRLVATAHHVGFSRWLLELS